MLRDEARRRHTSGDGALYGGNRRLNAILYRIALVQATSSPQAKAYLARRQAEGKTRREAIRALKRYVIRAIWRLWQRCQTSHTEPALTL